MRKVVIPSVIFVLALAFLLVSAFARQEEQEVQAQLVAEPPGMDRTGSPAGFNRADGPRLFEFPADHGPHPDFQTEWWYFTGNLQSADGRHFGYQLTFFRRALLPVDQVSERASGWSSQQVYMAHFALTDVPGQKFQAFERLQRGAVGLAGAQANPFQVWLDEWSVEATGTGVYRLRARQGELAIDLELSPAKRPVLQGDQGYSRKGSQPGQASYYYSLTRLVSQGSITSGSTSVAVNGLSWMDHEFSTSALEKDQVGWDWFALQLDNGSELMAFQIRKQDGSIDPFSSGTLIAPDGSTRQLQKEDFEIEVQDTWTSPHSGATYPERWTVRIPAYGLVLEIEPYLEDQELNLSYAYWEGAVRIRGQAAGREVNGSGYVEMTGYAGSMGGEF